MNLILLCLIGYLVGSIPTGFLLTKFYGDVDIREIGSHSTGATNVLRSGHKTLALLTLLGDAFKGILFTLFAKMISDDPYYLIAVFLCIIGHTYPIWLRFKGGKGVATSAGIFVVLSPLYALISISIWAILAKFLKISSIASIALAISFATLCSYGYFLSNTSLEIFIFSLVSLGFLLFTHSQNIERLIHHDEHSPNFEIQSEQEEKVD